jgi:hypothetical protein
MIILENPNVPAVRKADLSKGDIDLFDMLAEDWRIVE